MKMRSEISSCEESILCEIHHVSLDSNLGHEYTALSYVWGKPILDQAIFCDGCVIKVTSHLHEALRTLRSRHVSWIWVDAICIDQSNIAERNTQVPIMGRIFKQTKMTYAYLGKIDEDGEQVAGMTIRLAFLETLLKKRSRRDLQQLKDTDRNEVVLKTALQTYPYASEIERSWFSQWRDYCMAIFELRVYMSREETNQVLQALGLPVTDSPLWRRYADIFGHSPWFERGWVMQEAVLSPDLRLLIGSGTVDLKCISRSSIFCAFSGLAVSRVNLSGQLSLKAGRIRRLRDRQEPRELRQLLRIFRECETTDPRDKIYSLLGLADDLTIAAPKPDYNQSEENVFSSYARYLIQQQHQTSLDILIDAGIARGSTLILGTWVPRWDESQQPPLLRPPIYFDASGSKKSTFSYGSNSSLLVRGVLYDKVGQVEPPDDGSWYTWESRVSNLVQRSPRFSAESYAKALVADFWGHGLEFLSNFSKDSWTFTSLYEHAVAGQDIRQEVQQYMPMSRNVTETHDFVLTRNDNIGWVPRCTEEGDLICLVFGARMPLVIREIEHRKYILIGAAYIEGIMNGEAFEGTNLEEEDIMLL